MIDPEVKAEIDRIEEKTQEQFETLRTALFAIDKELQGAIHALMVLNPSLNSEGQKTVRDALEAIGVSY